MAEERLEIRRKRLYMRSIRRGIKEMDVILTGYADGHLGDLEGPALDTYEALLEENDHDIYQWVTGQSAPPDEYGSLVDEIGRTFTALMRRNREA